jgi:hypothetical protein
MSGLHPFKMLFMRLALFAIFQGLIALIFALMAKSNAWHEAQGWWIIMVY